MSFLRTLRLAAVFVVIAAVGSAATAPSTRHALLIGVGDYTHEVTDLEGPPHDIVAISQLLVERWGFAPKNITTLLDKAATKKAILSAIDSLAQKTRPSDVIFIYYSGHGTSSYELSDVGLDGNTGALVPADLSLEAADLKASLIVGSRDLRPRLEKLDADRHVFAVFDACYSGAAVRNLRAIGRPRYVALPTRSLSTAFADEDEGAFGSLTQKALPYPYSNLLYISAASRSEAARDVTTSDLRSGRARTVDGRPHGALTNALLDGLTGSGDTNRDGTLTYGELYSYVRDQVSQKFPQQPQLLVPEEGAAAFRSMGVMSGSSPRPAAPAPPPPSPRPTAAAGSPDRVALRVKLENLPASVDQEIRQTAGVKVSPGAYDLLVALEADGFRLYHGSGDVLASYPADRIGEVVARVARQVAVQELIDFSFPDQSFNVSVEIPGNRGFLTAGEAFGIQFGAERSSYILLVNIDNGGHVSVLYPFEPEELAATRYGSFGAPDELRVSPPFGTEFLKVFAFERKPVGFDELLEASFSPLGPELPRLLKMLRDAPGTKAQGRLKVVTMEKQ